MINSYDDIHHVAELDGARFVQTASGKWAAYDKYNTRIVQGAYSRAEAACLYCEDKRLIRTLH